MKMSHNVSVWNQYYLAKYILTMTVFDRCLLRAFSCVALSLIIKHSKQDAM